MVLITGCAHVVSKNVRDKADRGVPISSLFKDPESFKGSLIILGGTIVSSKNTREGTYIEVIEKPIDYRGRPKDTDKTSGRFIILHEGFLDTAIFSRGRYVTVAGEVLGKKILPLGEIQYSYLFIMSRELHLVRPGERFPIRFGIGIYHTFD